MEDDQLQRLRDLCLALPETTERLSHGEPTWFVRGKKTFVMFADHHHDDRLAFWCAAPPGVQSALIDGASGPLLRAPVCRPPRLARGLGSTSPSTGMRSQTSLRTPIAWSRRGDWSRCWTRSSPRLRGAVQRESTKLKMAPGVHVDGHPDGPEILRNQIAVLTTLTRA